MKVWKSVGDIYLDLSGWDGTLGVKKKGGRDREKDFYDETPKYSKCEVNLNNFFHLSLTSPLFIDELQILTPKKKKNYFADWQFCLKFTS